MKRLKLGANMVSIPMQRESNMSEYDRTSYTLHFEWRWHRRPGVATFGLRRVWRSDWGSDQFEILEEDDFQNFVKWATRFGFNVKEAEDE